MVSRRNQIFSDWTNVRYPLFNTSERASSPSDAADLPAFDFLSATSVVIFSVGFRLARYYVEAWEWAVKRRNFFDSVFRILPMRAVPS